MTENPSPAVTQECFTTSDPELTEDVLRSAYSDNHLVLSGRRADFAFGHWTIDAPGFSVNRLRIDVDLTFEAEARREDRYLVGAPTRGRTAYLDSAYDDTDVDATAPVLVPPHGGMRVVCEHLDEIVVALDPDRLAAHAAAVTGTEPDELVFTDIAPISPARVRHLNAAVAHVRDVLLDPWASTAPILLAQAFRTLAAATLATFPNTALAPATDPDTPQPRGEVPAAVLREVTDYLHTHADLPVGPGDIADLTGMPTHEITAGLRRRHGRHPAELLWQARLLGVYRDLLEADPESGAVIAETAARRGFSRPARFRIAYQREFGELPDETLRR